MGDIILYADGTYCDREDIFNGNEILKNQPYTVIAEGTAEWADFCIKHKLF